MDTSVRRGVFFGLISAFLFGIMGFLVHFSSGRIPSSEMVFFRSIFSFLVLLPYAWQQRSLLLSKDALPIWTRSIAGAGSVFCYFSNLQRSNVGAATALADFSPVFVLAISVLFFGENISWAELTGVLVATVGAAILHSAGFKVISTQIVSVGIAGAVMSAIAYVSLRRASIKFSGKVVVCCFSGVALVGCLFLDFQRWVIPRWEEASLILGVAVTGLFGQLWMTKSYAYLKAPVACALGVSALAWGLAMDIVFHGEGPVGWEWCGYLSLVIGVYVVQIRPARQTLVPRI